jgi:TP901 family phage tail tape measure protein
VPDLSKTIQIIFEGVDNLSGGLGDINTGIGALANGIEDATQPLANLTAGILAADAAALALGAAFVNASVKASIDFESSITDLNKVLGEGDGTITEYIPKITEMSDTFATSGTAVAQLSGDLKQAGFTADEVFGDPNGGFGLAELALTAVRISTLDADAASQVFVRTLSGFGESAGEAGRLLDILNESSNTSGASFDDLAEAFGRVGPVAKGAGLDFEQTAGFLVVLNEQFQSGEISGTAFNSIMLQLGSEMPRVADALDALGISQTDLNGVMRPTAEIIGELAEAWPTLTREQQNQAAQNLVGLEQAPKLLAILNDYPGVLEATATAYASSGSASKELNIALEQSAVQADRAKIQFENLQIAVGDKFKPAVVESGAAMGNLASAIREAVEGDTLEPFFDAVLPLFEEFGDYIDGIAEALPEAFDGVDWSDFEASIKAISESFGGIFGDLDLTNPRDLERVIQSLIDVGALFINTTSGIIDGLEPLFKIIGSVVDAFSDLSPEVQQAAGYLLGMGTTVNVLSGFVGTLSGALGGAGKVGGLVGSFAALGPVIAGASVALASFEVGKYISEVTGLDEALEEWLLGLKDIPPVIGASDDAIARSESTLKSLAVELGVSSLSMDEFNRLADSGKLVWDETAQKWTQAGSAAENLGTSFDAIGVDGLVAEFNALNPVLQLTADGTVRAANATDDIAASTGGLVQVLDTATGKWVDVTDATRAGAGAVADGGEELKAAAEKAELMTRASADFILGWEKDPKRRADCHVRGESVDRHRPHRGRRRAHHRRI